MSDINVTIDDQDINTTIGEDTINVSFQGVFNGLRIQEVDGTPDVTSVATIVFPNDSVTDDGNGQVTIDFVSNFLGLTDTPGDYTSQALKGVRVNNDETGLEFYTITSSISWGEIEGTLSDQTDLQDVLDLKVNISDFTWNNLDKTVSDIADIATRSHTSLTDIGTNTHSQIDSHIGDSSIHFTESSISHLNIQDIGSNSHLQIDSHISSTLNPHSVSLEQARTVSNVLAGDVNYNSVGSILNLNTTQFNTSYAELGTEPVGTTFYDQSNLTLSTVLLDNGTDRVTGSHFLEGYIYGKNTSGVDIDNGKAVSIIYFVGQFTSFGLTDATDSDSARAFVGIATMDIPKNGWGFITRQGIVRGIDTDDLDESKPVYVDPATPGDLTSTYPDPGFNVVTVGVCDYSHSSQGRILVTKQIQPRLSELSDVDGIPLDTNGLIPVWDNDNGYFDFTANINDYATISSLTFTEGSIPFAGSDGLLTEDNSNFLWNNSTKLLNISALDTDSLILNSSIAITSVSTGGADNDKLPTKGYVDDIVVGLLDYRGAYDASGNVFPSSGGSGTAGAILKGDMWVISVGGTLGGVDIQAGDSLIANTDTPGQTSTNWNAINTNISYVAEDQANKVTSISALSTDIQYPSAKLLFDQLALKDEILTFSTGLSRTLNTVTTNDSEIVHDNLSGFVSNEHIDHTTVTLTAGDGLSGGGDISANRSFAVNVDNSTIEINLDTLRVKADGIDDTHIDWGTGANQVSAVDVPIADAGNYFDTDNVESALQQSAKDILDDRTITKEPTGFTNPEDVIITANGDRTVTLTGTVNAYYRGVLNTTIIDGYTSPVHDNTTTTQFFLTYNGTDIDWRDLSIYGLNFDEILICIAFYDNSNSTWIYLHESHGVMPWQTHKELHTTIGTYKDSGGTLGDYTLSSTTAADRRPSVSESLIYDEDNPTTIPALVPGTYTQYFLSGADGTANFATSAADIVPLSTARPYFNEFTGGSWTQSLMTNNYYMAVWVIQIPVTVDSSSQTYRTIFAQGQSQSSSLEDIQALTPNDYNAGELIELTPESVFIAKVILRYIGGNWRLVEVDALTGTRFSQASSPTGNYLSSVTSDVTLSGTGTATDPLGVVQTPYPLLAGRTGGQTLAGSDTTAEDLTLKDNTVDNNTITVTEMIAKMDNPMTTAGDVIYGGASGVPTRLGIGTAGQVFATNAGATAPEWIDAPSGGGGATIFDCTVDGAGSGDYTTVGAAIADSKVRPLLIGSTTETGNITLPDGFMLGSNDINNTVNMQTYQFGITDNYEYQFLGGTIQYGNTTNLFSATNLSVYMLIKDMLFVASGLGKIKFEYEHLIIDNVKMALSNVGVSINIDSKSTGYVNVSNLILSGGGTSCTVTLGALSSVPCNFNNIVFIGSFNTTTAITLRGTVSNMSIYASGNFGILTSGHSEISGIYMISTRTLTLKGAGGVVTGIKCGSFSVTGSSFYLSCVDSSATILIGSPYVQLVSFETVTLNVTSSASILGLSSGRVSGSSTISGDRVMLTSIDISGNLSINSTADSTRINNCYVLGTFSNLGTTTEITGLNNIEDRVITSMKNTSGGNLVAGNVVIRKSVAANNEVTTTTTAGDSKVFGVLEKNISNNATNKILTQGITVLLKVDGTDDIAIGDYLSTFTTAGIAAKASSGHTAFAIALEAYTNDDSNGVIDAILVTPRYIP